QGDGAHGLPGLLVEQVDPGGGDGVPGVGGDPLLTRVPQDGGVVGDVPGVQKAPGVLVTDGVGVHAVLDDRADLHAGVLHDEGDPGAVGRPVRLPLQAAVLHGDLRRGAGV